MLRLQMNHERAVVCGVLGLLTMTALLLEARWMGVPVNLETTIGSAFGGQARGGSYFLGWIIMLLCAIPSAWLYAVVFEYITYGAGLARGLYLGGVQGVLTVCGLELWAISSRSPRALWLLDSGISVQVVLLLSFIAFGGVVGAAYGQIVHERRAFPRDELEDHSGKGPRWHGGAA